MRRSFALVVATLVLACVSQATTITLTGVLSGLNENPPTPSAGTGTAVVTLDTVAQTLMVNVVFSGLSSGTTASHIHCCVAPPGNAGVATTTPSFPNFPLGVTSGSYLRIFDLTSSTTYNPAFITAQGSLAAAETALINGLLNDQTYLNIHTTAFPGGEVRAFLVPTPEPSALVLALSGFAGLWVIRRRLH